MVTHHNKESISSIGMALKPTMRTKKRGTAAALCKDEIQIPNTGTRAHLQFTVFKLNMKLLHVLSYQSIWKTREHFCPRPSIRKKYTHFHFQLKTIHCSALCVHFGWFCNSFHRQKNKLHLFFLATPIRFYVYQSDLLSTEVEMREISAMWCRGKRTK